MPRRRVKNEKLSASSKICLDHMDRDVWLSEALLLPLEVEENNEGRFACLPALGLESAAAKSDCIDTESQSE